MNHFFYLVGFAALVSLCFGVFNNGSTRDRVIYGSKTFVQFILISLAIAWVLYFIP